MAAHQKILHIEKRGWKCIKHAEYPTNRREYKGCKTSRGRYKMLGDDKNVKEKRGHNITLGVKLYIEEWNAKVLVLHNVAWGK